MFISICVNMLHVVRIHTYPTGVPGGIGRHALVPGGQNSALSNYESALKCTVWLQCTLISDRGTDKQTDGQADGRTAWQ